MNSKAIVLSSHTIGLGVIRSLGEMGIPVVVMFYEKSDMGYVSKFVRQRYFIPHPEYNCKQFLDNLISFTHLHGAIIIPADDVTLSVVSQHKKMLSEYYIVACQDWYYTKRFIDKKYTYKYAERSGIAIPTTFYPESEGDIVAIGESVEFPCIVKPCKSHQYFSRFNRKITEVNDKIELEQAYNEATYANIDVIVQEYIPGDDTCSYNYNSFYHNGAPVSEFTAQKLRQGPSRFGVPRVVKSGDYRDVVDLGRQIVSLFRYNGYSCIEFKRDTRDNSLIFMEVNARYNRSLLLSHKFGINFPYYEYCFLKGITPYQNTVASKEIYWIDDVRDVLFSLYEMIRRKISIKNILAPYLQPHIFSVFDVNDMKPFFKRLYYLFQLLLFKAMKRIKVAGLRNTRNLIHAK